MSSVLAAFEMAGLLTDLENGALTRTTVKDRGSDQAALLGASLRYLIQRGLVEENGDAFTLTDYGRDVCQDKGYLVWLVGGYGEPLRRMDAFLSGDKRYGVDYPRDGRWVADGAAMLGRKDVVPHALRLLEGIEFDTALDLGCGNARFLLTVCSRFGASGTGVDISPEAVVEAEKAVREARLTDRVRVVRGDAGDLNSIAALADTQLVVTFFLLHEILAQGRDALVAYLSDMAGRLPDGARLLIAEVQPPAEGDHRPWFTPEFTFVHALMRQTLLDSKGWSEALADGGFTVREVLEDDMPGGILILAEKAR
ncbi:SAM-dependent methyltransferase [Actinoallomurus sp. CA-142502]|uniref:SAM-dependent methyltransferase n=1 Tax=Actinoallomurus sp. CA-142502 TaxID=3239885 RepID=UPI003D929F63